MRMIRRICFLGVTILACASSAWAATRYVNVSNAAPASPFTNWATASTNIQLAINAAASGDEILVAPGVYRTTNYVSIPGQKRLTLRSTVSRAAVMDAQQLSLALLIWGTNSVVEGFTIRNGLHDSYGGGIILYSAGTVRDCLVVSNQASGGAGIYINNNTSRVENCTIQYNLATDFGGGVLFYNHATGVVNNCTIANNVASNEGGGVYFQAAGILSNCWIWKNRASSSSAGSGGGAYMDHGGRLVNSVVVSNRAEYFGGGVRARYGSYLAHNTIADNLSIGHGGGVWMADACTSWNNIVYYNVASLSNDVWASLCVFSNTCSATDLGGSNFTNAPLFVNRFTRNFRLEAGSPCIDAGATNPAVAIDYEGAVRPQAGTPGGPAKYDVGAYEYVLPAATSLSIAPAGTNLPAAVLGSPALSVTANGAWVAATNRSWLAITAGGAGTTNGTVSFTASLNGTGAARTGAITVAAGSLVRTCTVIQASIGINYYRDADGDGYGNPGDSLNTNSPPVGYVTNNTDPDDAHASVYPGAPEIPDGLDNDGDSQIDEGARDGKTCFALAQAVGCTGAGWSRTLVMDLTNFRNLAAQDGYQSYAVAYALYYNIWTGMYLYDYDAGGFSAVTWLMNLDL